MSFLQIENLSQRFENGADTRTTYQDVNLSLEKGEFLCIIGPSGCGKTTLLRTVGGFLPPTDGRILLNGRPITGPGSHCAMIFQTFEQLFPWRTVLGNVTYPLLVSKQCGGKAEAAEKAKQYLAMVGLLDYGNYYPYQLSGGMKQRVAIARALALEPELILMDEPFASLDADTRTNLQKELKRIWSESGLTVLFVTHSIIEAIGLSTKLLVLSQEIPSVKFYGDNPVEGPRDAVKTPESPGYGPCWAKLNDMIRHGNGN